MTYQEISEKCRYFGLHFDGKWDDKFWAHKNIDENKWWGECIQYELTNEFFNK